jgi:hypothetical protein
MPAKPVSRRIMYWCISQKKDAFVEELKKGIHEFYGEDASIHKRYCRIINDRHFQRLIGLLDSKKIIYGGRSNPENRYIEPMILSPSLIRWDLPNPTKVWS